MKLSGLKWPFSLRPQSTVNVPVVAPCWGFGAFTLALTFVMSTNSDGSAPSALAASSLPAFVTTTATPAASARPAMAAVSFVRREKWCRAVERVMVCTSGG
ncbi:hypothetical protein CLV43_110309 [Umezawaea tangerina]|uniref:Uncharacterized protein n=1 Tax=Umezawaea tangerina TaxID=84725 RepID=A0A2T0SVP5_9PSEU|nr:hypothetical protein CLV43_110309 [Umezawaea tangerina]